MTNHPFVRRMAAVGGIAALTVSGVTGVSHAQTGSLGLAVELGLNLDLTLGSDGGPLETVPDLAGSLEAVGSDGEGSLGPDSLGPGGPLPAGSLDDIDGSVEDLVPTGSLDALAGSLTAGSEDGGSLEPGSPDPAGSLEPDDPSGSLSLIHI